jgi:hypothetical protein
MMIKLMTVEEGSLEPIVQAYEQVFDVFDGNQLSPEMAFSLMVRLAVQLSGDMSKQEFIALMSEAHDLDRLLRSTPEEMH